MSLKIKPLVGEFIETTRQLSSVLFVASIALGLGTEDSLLLIPSFITAAGLNIFGNKKQMNYSSVNIKEKEYPTSITILARISEDDVLVEKDGNISIFKPYQNHDLYGQINSIAEKELNIYNAHVSHEDIVKEGLITINGETTYNYVFVIDDFTLDIGNNKYFKAKLDMPFKRYNPNFPKFITALAVSTSVAFTNSMVYHYLKSDMLNSINAAVGAAVALTGTLGLYMYKQYERKKQGILIDGSNIDIKISHKKSVFDSDLQL